MRAPVGVLIFLRIVYAYRKIYLFSPSLRIKALFEPPLPGLPSDRRPAYPGHFGDLGI